MHRYLHNYEDFLLIDDDSVAWINSKLAVGPKSKPFPEDSGDDDDYEPYDSDDGDWYDEKDSDYVEFEERFERHYR